MQCSQCGYAASGNKEIRDNVSTVHYQEKGLHYSQCDYATSQNEDIEKHISDVHNKDKGFQRSQCDYLEAKNVDLERHANTVHISERVFKCGQCDYATTQSWHLKRHVNVIHNQEVKCPHCDSISKDIGDFKMHMIMMHKSTGTTDINKDLVTVPLTYDPRVSNYGKVIRRHHTAMITKNKHLEKVFKRPPMPALRQPPNLRKIICKDKLYDASLDKEGLLEKENKILRY